MEKSLSLFHSSDVTVVSRQHTFRYYYEVQRNNGAPDPRAPRHGKLRAKSRQIPGQITPRPRSVLYWGGSHGAVPIRRREITTVTSRVGPRMGPRETAALDRYDRGCVVCVGVCASKYIGIPTCY
jgi:hypothetical protein